jgi:excisionase family DNA binding protein
MEEQKELLTVREAAHLLGMPDRTLYTLIYKRSIPHLRFSKRIIRFSRTEIKAWIEKSSVSILEAENE